MTDEEHEEFMERHHKTCMAMLSVILCVEITALVVLAAGLVPIYVTAFFAGCAAIYGMLSGLQIPAAEKRS